MSRRIHPTAGRRTEGMDASLADAWPAAACGWAVYELVLFAPWSRCYLPAPRRERGALSMHDPAQAERDERLVAAMAAGDRDALGELYDRFAPVLLGVALRMLGSSREAEDVVRQGSAVSIELTTVSPPLTELLPRF